MIASIKQQSIDEVTAMSKPLTMGFLARVTDVNVKTVRYYQ